MPRQSQISPIVWTLLAVVCGLSIANATLPADETALATRCNNEVFAAFILPEAGHRVALTSQAIDRVLFSQSKIGQIHWNNPAFAEPTSRHGNHSGTVTFTMEYPKGGNDEVFTPRVVFAIDLLPKLPPMVGRTPKGSLVGVYSGFDMTPMNGWFPAETRLGAFGATFLTQKSETPKSDREFIRVPPPVPNVRTSFSLPIDVSKDRTIRDLSGVKRVSMQPYAVYEDFKFTEWLIYSRTIKEGVEISQCQCRWDNETFTLTLNGEISTQRYKIGDMVQVSNLEFRVEEIVEGNQQAVPAAWVNIADIDVVRKH